MHPSTEDNPGSSNTFHFTWQMIAVIIALVASVATFAIQLGTVQTYVNINTERLRESESDRKEIRSKLDHLNSIQDQVNKMILDYEKQRKELMTRDDALNALNTTKVEFAAEIKRLDQIIVKQMTQEAFQIYKEGMNTVLSGLNHRLDIISNRVDGKIQK